VQALHAIFLKDQAAYQRPSKTRHISHLAAGNVADADELIATDLAQYSHISVTL